MADILRIVRLLDNGRKRTQVLLDLADIAAGSIAPARGSWAYQPGAKSATVADAGRRYGGGREVGNAHENGILTRSFIVKGSSADLALLALERIIQETEDYEGKFLEWRPDGASRSVYSELRGTSPWSPKYEWLRFAQIRSVDLDLSFIVAPLARGDALDFIEDWSGANPLADYTDRTGTNALQITAGQLAPNGALTSQRRLIFTGRGYVDRDAVREVSFVWGSTLANQWVGLVLMELDPANYVNCTAFDNGTSSTLNLGSTVAGAPAQTAAPVGLTRLVAGQRYWLRGRNEGYVFVAEFFTSQPGPATAPVATITLTLASASEKAIADTAGRGGIDWRPQNADARIVSYSSRPWSWTLRSLPEVETLKDVPGTAPPLFEAHLTPSGGAAAPIFCLLGWWRRASVFNMVWNGDAEDNANGWATGPAVWGMAAATSVLRTTGQKKYGNASIEIVTTATAGSGGFFRIYRRFRKGVTYTLRFWVRNPTAAINAAFGRTFGTNLSAVLAPGASSAFVEYSTTWIPTADVDYADAGFYTPGGVQTFQIDGLQVYEGAVAPTINQHAEGKGAPPPLGIVKAESHDGANLSGWALTADANYLGGFGLKVTTAGAGAAGATYLVDPSLLQDDDFASGTLHVEVWALVELAAGVVTPRLNVTALPESGIAAERLGDWGTAGRGLGKPSTGTAKRPVRIGLLRLPTTDQQRWRLKVAASWQAGSAGVFGLDYLWLDPARARATSPNGKANDPSYPKFVPATGEITRRILPDLSGQTIKEPGYPSSDAGLGGAPLELPPPVPGAIVRDVDVLVKLSSLVPDDPTVDATTEQLAHSASVHFGITPRYFLTRPS